MAGVKEPLLLAPLSVEDGKAGAGEGSGATAGGGWAAVRNRTTWGLVGAAVVVNAVLVGGGLAMVGNEYAENFDDQLDARAVTGTAGFFLGHALGPLLAGLATVYVAQHRGLPTWARVATLGALAAGCALGVILSAAYLLQVRITFRNIPHPDNYRQFLGGFIVVTYTILGVGIATVAARTACDRAGGHDGGAGRRGHVPAAPQPHTCRRTAAGATLFAAVVAATWFLTSFMTPVWNYSATSYFVATSPYSLVDATWNLGINYNGAGARIRH